MAQLCPEVVLFGLRLGAVIHEYRRLELIMVSNGVESAATETTGGGVSVAASPMLAIVEEQGADTDGGPLWRRLWEGWKRVGKKFGNFQARVLLGIFYAIFLAPFAVMLRWLSDPLAIKPGSKRGWLPRNDDQTSPKELAKRQF
jgi:hypothetical protein